MVIRGERLERDRAAWERACLGVEPEELERIEYAELLEASRLEASDREAAELERKNPPGYIRELLYSRELE